MAKPSRVGEKESLQVAEASRQKEWSQPSFMRQLFLGTFALDLVYPFPLAAPERPEFEAFFNRLEKFLATDVDSTQIDATGEYPDHVVAALREMGAFGMKISKEYGGLGFTQVEYQKVMKLLGSVDGNLCALLSAHQSIGVPQPVKLFGSERLKKKYLPRCAAGQISAFALTEPEVGSDPAQLSTTITLTPDGSEFVLNGTKLWCTNGTLADFLVVMAVHPDTRKISALVVETAWPGVTIERRCRFMGLKALANAVIQFENVRVPRENLIGEEGRGLKIALTTLNDGRLSIPNSAVGAAKTCLQIVKRWANERVQWGKAIGKHEAIAQLITRMAATTFAMESMADLATQMSDQGKFDIRLEAAATKEWNSTQSWNIIDDTMQIRGGRGYETAESLKARGEAPIPVERMMRDSRINRIFEGSSEIMHLFMARELVDKRLQVAGSLVDPRQSLGKKLAGLPRIGWFYAIWYPTRWLGWGRWPRFSRFSSLAPHLRFVERSSRKLARESFHGMVVHGARLQNKQAFLFRLVDIANELFAMSASISRAQTLKDRRDPEAKQAGKLALAFCEGSRRRIRRLFQDLWKNNDIADYKLAKEVLSGGQDWLFEGSAELDDTIAAALVSSAPFENRPSRDEAVEEQIPTVH